MCWESRKLCFSGFCSHPRRQVLWKCWFFTYKSGFQILGFSHFSENPQIFQLPVRPDSKNPIRNDGFLHDFCLFRKFMSPPVVKNAKLCLTIQVCNNLCFFSLCGKSTNFTTSNTNFDFGCGLFPKIQSKTIDFCMISEKFRNPRHRVL